MNEDIIEKFGNLNLLSYGADSWVLKDLDTNTITKIYLSFLSSLDFSVERCSTIIKQYIDDTILAKELLELKNNSYCNSNLNIKIEIIPQGKIKIMENKVMTIGQEYIKGINLLSLQSSEHYNLDESKLVRRYSSEIIGFIKNTEQMINQYLKSNFTISQLNIKPILDVESNELVLKVTDLAKQMNQIYGALYKKLINIKIRKIR